MEDERVNQSNETAVPAATASNHHSKVGTVWVSLAGFVIVLLLLVIFILQNSQTVRVSYLGMHGKVGFGVALLVAAIAGSLLTLLVGSVRIVQLRLAARKSTTASRN